MRRVFQSSFLRAVTVLASGTALAQALPVLLTPVVSRLFAPDDFGVLGLFTSFITMTATVVGLSFPLAIVSNISRVESARLTMLSLIVAAPVSFVLIGVMWLLRHNAWLGFGELPVIALLWAWVCLLSIGVFNAFRYWQLSQERYRKIARATMSQSVGRMLGQVTTGLLSLGGGGLIFSEVIGRSAGVFELVRASWGRVRALTSEMRSSDYWIVAKEYRKFPLISTPSSLINSVALSLPIPLLASAYGLSQAGQFSMSHRALALPVSVIGAAVADVFHGHLARSASKGPDVVRRLFLRVGLGLFAIGAIPSIFIWLWGQRIFEFVLGSDWSLAGTIASGIMPWILMSFVVGPLSRVVLVFRGQEVKLIYDVLALVGIVGVVLLGSAQDWSIEVTARLLGLSQSLAYLVYFGLLWRIVRVKTVPETRSSDD